MKLAELFEYIEAHEETLFNVAAKTIVRDCKPFLQELKRPGEVYLYRGAQRVPIGNSSVIAKRKVNKNRTPKDIHPKFHEFYDKLMNEKFGHKFRSQAVFATNTERQAAGYGSPYLIYPIGKISYIWSDDIQDLFINLDAQIYYKIVDIAKNQPERFKKIGLNPEDSVKSTIKLLGDKIFEFLTDKEFKDLIDLDSYYTNNIDKMASLGKTTEAMIVCDEYYLVDYYNEDGKEYFLNTLKEQYENS